MKKQWDDHGLRMPEHDKTLVKISCTMKKRERNDMQSVYLYCPLGFDAANRADTACYKEKCGWWVVETCECAISSLAVSLAKIADCVRDENESVLPQE